MTTWGELTDEKRLELCEDVVRNLNRGKKAEEIAKTFDVPVHNVRIVGAILRKKGIAIPKATRPGFFTEDIIERLRKVFS